jgi:hypothetical protein
MGTGLSRIDKLGDIGFRGRVGDQVALYAKETQRIARDLARQLEEDASRAEKQMRKLEGLPGLFGLDVRLRARIVSRQFHEIKELLLAVSAESVKFNAQYRKEFLDTDAAKRDKRKKQSREVDL